MVDRDDDLEQRAAKMFIALLGATHLSRPDELSDILAKHARLIGIAELVMFLVDYEQRELVPVHTSEFAARSVQRIEGTIAGRCFAYGEIQDVEAASPDVRRLWLPLLDGTERLGVIEMLIPHAAGTVEPGVIKICERLSHLAAQLVIGKSQYGDRFELVRRRRPMTIAAEMQWSLLPPLVFATNGLVVAGMLEPAYDVGGDSFDYAVNDRTAQIAVLDAMGHGLSAAVTATVAVGAYRNARRRLLDLAGIYGEIDTALSQQFAGERYATAVLGRLELDTGVLTWISAGHPPPLLIRSGRLVKVLDCPPHTPLGVEVAGGEFGQGASEQLEPGDQVLFYTDGLTEARTADGGFFTVERLAAFLEKEAAAGLPPPETLRRLRHAVLTRQDVQLKDDATALLLEWRKGSELSLVPQTVEP